MHDLLPDLVNFFNGKLCQRFLFYAKVSAVISVCIHGMGRTLQSVMHFAFRPVQAVVFVLREIHIGEM